MKFDYNQLNIVGRDRSSTEFIQKSLIGMLERLRDKVKVDGQEFKNVVTIADQVWSGADKELFINNLKAVALERVQVINALITDLRKYINADLDQFSNLQKNAQRVVSTKR